MNISNIVINKEEDESFIAINFDFVIKNKNNKKIDLLKYDILGFDQDGYALSSSGSESYSHECELSSDEEFESMYFDNINKIYLNNLKKVTYNIHARSFVKKTHILGVIDLPDSNKITFKNFSLDDDHFNNEIKLSAIRLPPDDDGEITVETRCLIQNKSDLLLESVGLQVEVHDKDGNVLTNKVAQYDLRKDSSLLFDPSFAGLSKKQLKGATLEISLIYYNQISTDFGTISFPMI